MIEIRLFATLRENRGKVLHLDAADYHTGTDIIRKLQIPQEHVAIFLINGFHSSPEDTVKDGSYVVQRPFVIVTRTDEALSEVAQNFFDYITSADAAEIIAGAGAVAANQ